MGSHIGYLSSAQVVNWHLSRYQSTLYTVVHAAGIRANTYEMNPSLEAFSHAALWDCI